MDDFLESEFLRADDLIAENLIEEAKAILNGLIIENPNFGKAHNHLGWIAKTKESDSVSAENHYKTALETSPEYAATYLNYAYLLSEQKRMPELEQLLLKAETVPAVRKDLLDREWAYYFEDTRQFERAIEKYKQYAMSLYDNSLLEKAKEGITRCRQKIEIQNL